MAAEITVDPVGDQTRMEGFNEAAANGRGNRTSAKASARWPRPLQ